MIFPFAFRRSQLEMFLFLLFAALLACFGADGDRHAARRDVRADVRQRSSIRRSVTLVCLSDGTKIWISTEADRSATTLLLPSEY